MKIFTYKGFTVFGTSKIVTYMNGKTKQLWEIKNEKNENIYIASIFYMGSRGGPLHNKTEAKEIINEYIILTNKQ